MAQTRKTFVVVSDRCGFVGAFADVDAARAALRLYIDSQFPLIFTEWPGEPPEPGKAEETSVWVLPYRANGAVAFASLDRAAAEKVQGALLRLSLVPADGLEFWESELGAVGPAARRRFDEVFCVRDAVNAATPAIDRQEKRDQATVARFLDFASRGQGAAEPARIDLLASVVPRVLDVEA